MMVAYLVYTRDETIDAAEMSLYSEAIRATFVGHDIKVLAAYGTQDVLEGPQTEGTVIAEFPTMAAARAWYDSPAYRRIREHRFNGARYRGVLVQGV